MTVEQTGENALPGADLVAQGLADLAAGNESAPALLVSIGAPKLRAFGINIPATIDEPNQRLYQLLQKSHGDAAHSRYNALIRRLVSHERALQCVITDRARIERFMGAIAHHVTVPTSVYFAGGATAVLYGLRATTIDVDIKIVPDRDEVLHAIPKLKDDLRLNIELALPSDFIPVRDDWRARSPVIEHIGSTSFHHFDLYAQALSKIERGHPQDAEDVTAMFARGLVDGTRLRQYFADIEPMLYRYPALDPRAFREAVIARIAEEQSSP